MVNKFNEEIDFSYNSDVIYENCFEYNIDSKIPLFYIKYFQDGEIMDLNLTLPCGVGKTLGLAIALKACPNLFLTYVASNHKRLRDFADYLDLLDVQYTLVTDSEQLNENRLVLDKVILMTSSMMIQFYNSSLSGISKARVRIERTLIIDECPKILTPIAYNRLMLYNFYKVCLQEVFTVNNKYEPPFILMNEYTSLNIRNLFEIGAIRVLDDLAINKRKRVLEDTLDLEAKSYFLTRVLGRDRCLDIKDFYKSFELTYDENKIYSSLVLTPAEVILDRYKKTLILDATADLYSEVLPGVNESLGIKKEYDKYIDKIYDLNDLYELRDYKYLTKKSEIIEKFPELIHRLISNLTKNKKTYLVTYNSAIYEENKIIKGSIYNILKEFYQRIENDPEGDFIYCSNNNSTEIVPGDLLIANYNRNRGTNKFRECDNIILLGQFNLPLNQLISLQEGLETEIAPNELQLKLSIGDAVQEISRGCLRQRKEDKRETIYLFGTHEWKLGICKYLNMSLSATSKTEEQSLETKLLDYKLNNQNNSRKYNYLRVVDLILEDSIYSPRFYLNYEYQILKNPEPFPSDYYRPWNFINKIMKELGLTEEEVNKITSWK